MKKKKIIKYGIWLVVVVVVLYNSVYFRSLSEVRTEKMSQQFNAEAYAKNFWENQLLPNLEKAVEINYLIENLETEKEQTFETYSNALGIGNIRYFLVKGTGNVEQITENEVRLLTENGNHKINIETEFIFGNAVRDASGMIDINEFTNTMDFNNISAEINKIIRTNIVPPFREEVEEGEQVEFVGAIELNREHMNLDSIEVIPIRLSISSNLTALTDAGR